MKHPAVGNGSSPAPPATVNSAGTASSFLSNVLGVADATDTSTDTATVRAGLSKMVAELRSGISSRKTSIASTIGELKTFDSAIKSLDATPTLQSIKLIRDMANLAVLVLPDDTKRALAQVESGSGVAMELVRRNLTQLPNLSQTLYSATTEALEADTGLRSIHAELAPGLELYGALVAHGVNPRKRVWAHRLTEKISSLSELRFVSWQRLTYLVGIGSEAGTARICAVEGGGSDDNESEDEKEAGEKKDPEAATVPEHDEAGAANKANQQTAEQRAMQALVMAAARPAVPPPPALTQGEVHVLENLYSSGIDAPPIRKQALTFGLGLDAANHLEDDNITTSSKLTEASIRKYQTRLQVPGMSEEDVKSALNAMVSNKGQPETSVAVASDDEDDVFFGSYDTNEELVAAAGGGMALYGINFFPNENDVTLKPYAPILAKPTFVEMAGASASFEASVLQSTEKSMASTFTNTTENGGISIAKASSTSWGVTASVSGLGGVAGASTSDEKKGSKKDTANSTSTNAFSANSKTSTTSATMVETITCPMKSFRIPVSTMKMSEEALDSALQVDTLLKASRFLDTFGSHVSNGRHLLGGIFFRTMTMTTESEVGTSTLLATASTQMQQSRTESSDVGASAAGGMPAVSGKASSSMGSASSSGVATFHSTAGREENSSADSRAMFQTYVRSMGPNVATPELFAEALFTDTSSWTVIDRGPFEALLPITNVLENMLVFFDVASPGKTQLENAINLVTVAWQQRALAWKHLGEDPAVPISLRNMIGRSFATEDAHDKIRAAVIDLFEILDVENAADTEQTSDALSKAVLETAKEMESKPAGEADFFATLQKKIGALMDERGGKYSFKEGSTEYSAATRSAKKLSSSDWTGFDKLWQRRMGTNALKQALDNHLDFEQATLRLGEVVTMGEPLVSINKQFQLEISGKTLRVVSTDQTDVAVATLFECEGTLGKKTTAHMKASGAFVLDLTLITGFDRAETKVVLWKAPNTEGSRGSYARMQNDGKFVVFNKKGKVLWSK